MQPAPSGTRSGWGDPRGRLRARAWRRGRHSRTRAILFWARRKILALAGEVDTDLRHDRDDQELRRQQVFVRHQARIPGFHGWQEANVKKSDERLAQHSPDEERQQEPEDYFFSYIRS